jgi:hypothetical protein
MTKINIGGGYKRYDGFLNLDMDHHTNPDFIVNLEKDLLPFDDSTVDEVKAHHILEHLGEGFFHLMKELYRICKDGAIIDIVVPHHRHDIFLADPTHRRPILIEGLRLFSKKYNYDHIEKHGSSSGLGIAFDVDFEIVQTGYTLDPFYEDYVKNTEVDIVIEKERSCNNFIQETKIKLMVVK